MLRITALVAVTVMCALPKPATATLCFPPIGVVFPSFDSPLDPTGWIIVRVHRGALTKVSLTLVDHKAPSRRFPLRVVRTHRRPDGLDTVVLKPRRALPSGREMKFPPELHAVLRLPTIHFEYDVTTGGKRPPPRTAWVIGPSRRNGPGPKVGVAATLVDSVDYRKRRFGLLGPYSRRRFAFTPSVAGAAMARVVAGSAVEYVPLESDGSLAFHWGACFATVPYRAGARTLTAELLDTQGRSRTRPVPLPLTLPGW